MSIGVPIESDAVNVDAPAGVVVKPAPVVSTTLVTVAGLVVPLVTIIGLIVLIALHAVSAEAGIGLIGGLAGLHGGASVATNANR